MTKKDIGFMVAISLVVGSIFFGLITSSNNVAKQREKRNFELYKISQQPIVGEVIEEIYSDRLESVPARRINGIVSQAYSNETVKLDSSYTLKVETSNGRVLAVSVIDGPGVKKEGLDILINARSEEVAGSMIRFPRGNLQQRGSYTVPNEKYFHEDTQFGNKRADRIKIE